MRIIAILLLVCVTSVALQNDAHAILGLAKATILVVDEFDKTIEGASVGVGFQFDKSWATDVRGTRGITDENGKLSASNSGNGYIGYGAKKEGYYESSHSYQFEESSLVGWKPWNPELKVVLRKIGNPVPMYARLAEFRFPVANKYIGLDLIKSDWVAPYGNGTEIDILFNLNVIDNGGNDFEYNLTIKHPNKFDGMIEHEENMRQGSVFKLPRIAPLEGYKSEHKAILRGVKRGAKISWKDSRHYIIRVRSEEENGEFKRAMYGKIVSDITITGAKKGEMPGIKFKYYLNPDYTRNLEFDTKQNLFKNLQDRERVNEP